MVMLEEALHFIIPLALAQTHSGLWWHERGQGTEKVFEPSGCPDLPVRAIEKVFGCIHGSD